MEKLTARLKKTTGASIDDLEVIVPNAAPAWWRPPVINIKADKKLAEKAHKELLAKDTESLFIYTDGSGINGKIGAAAVSPNRMINCFLGPITVFTVYSAELYSTILAAILTSSPNYRCKTLIICIDNQVAIRAVENPGCSSGQHIVKHIVKFIHTLRSKGTEMEITLGPHSNRDQRQQGSEYSSEAGYRVEAKKTQKRQSYGAGHGLEGKAGYVGLAP